MNTCSPYVVHNQFVSFYICWKTSQQLLWKVDMFLLSENVHFHESSDIVLIFKEQSVLFQDITVISDWTEGENILETTIK